MLEKTIEKKLTAAVKKAGGIAPKFVSPSFAGMPDRLILLPDGKFAFAELKAPGESPRPLQKARHRLLRSLGFRVYVIDSIEPRPCGGRWCVRCSAPDRCPACRRRRCPGKNFQRPSFPRRAPARARCPGRPAAAGIRRKPGVLRLPPRLRGPVP